MLESSPIRWFGGKNRLDLKNWILPILKTIPHRVYIEVFGGSGSLLIAKTPSFQEVYNDIDKSLYEFFNVLSTEELFEKFYRKVSVLPYSRQIFEESFENQKSEDLIERVSSWFIVMRGLFGSIPDIKTWSRSYKSKDAWLNCLEGLPNITKRLQPVLLENLDWKDCIDKYDSWMDEEVLFYLDPPYIQYTRKGGKYKHEMSNGDHKELVERILKLKSHVVLSGYENEIYKPLEQNGWELQKKRVSISCGDCTKEGIKGERVECLWIKPFKNTKSFFI